MLKIDTKYNLIAGIYKISCLKNGKSYIGSSIDLLTRLREHVAQLRNGNHHSTYMQRCFNKYGEDNFKVEVLATLEVFSEEILRILEFIYIEKLKPEFNTITPLCVNITEEWKKKISESTKALYRNGYVNPRFNTGKKYDVYNSFCEKVLKGVTIRDVALYVDAKDYHFFNTLLKKYDGITLWKGGLYAIMEQGKPLENLYDFYRNQLNLNRKTRFLIKDSTGKLYTDASNYKTRVLKQCILNSENFHYEENGIIYTLSCLPI